MINRLFTFKVTLAAFTLYSLSSDFVLFLLLCLSLMSIVSLSLFIPFSIISMSEQYQTLIVTYEIHGIITLFLGIDIVIFLFVLVPIIIGKKIFRKEIEKRGIKIK